MKKLLFYNGAPLIMGVLNVTPDSFFDGGRYLRPEEAIDHALNMAENGADIIDVGGESTRPLAQPVSIGEELKRILPVIEGIRTRSDVLISVDTYKSRIAEEACTAGADIVNDISGLVFDGNMAKTVAKFGAYVVIMHIKGTPQTMQKDPHYEDVISEIKDFFIERIDFAASRGIREDRIILDPGIGFGKRVEDNLRIIKMLDAFKSIGRPILIGTSMKSFIGHITNTPVEERTDGTLASIAISLWNGADIVRVHDVEKARRVAEFVEAVKRA